MEVPTLEGLSRSSAETLLGTTIRIKPGKKGAGKLVVAYSSHEHLDDLLNKLTR